MSLFGGFLALFLVIFAVVLVVTGEWEARVEPALRLGALRFLDIGEPEDVASTGEEGGETEGAESAEGAGSTESAGPGDGAGEEATGGDGTGSAASGELAEGGSGEFGEFEEFGEFGSFRDWRVAQDDSLRSVREHVADLKTRIGALEAQLVVIQTARDQGEVDAWKSLGRMFASMRSEEAGRILEHLPDTQAVQLLATMNPRNSAELMGKLNPDRAARLSGRLGAYLRDLNTEASVQ